MPPSQHPRILEIFDSVQRHQVFHGEEVVQVFPPELNALQRQVLELLHVPADTFAVDTSS